MRVWLHPASRRQALRAAAGGALGGLAALVGIESARAACRGNGEECKRAGQCCSGVCTGGKCKRAFFQKDCTTDRAFCKGGHNGCNGNPNCTCFQSVTGAVMCAEVAPCWPCATDADCASVVGPRSICGRGVGPCAGVTCSSESGGTFCARVCDPND